MDQERRSAPRARVPGVQVIYESASGERVEADVADIGTGGVFIRTSSPLPVGKRLSLEIRLVGGSTPWQALGRVVWVREVAAGDAPPGMGVKLIDVEDAVVQAIERLVKSRERTEPGTGIGKSPPREPTVLGVGMAGSAAPPGAAPIVSVAPSRERTVLGIGIQAGPYPAPGAPAAPTRERSQVEPAPDGWDVPEAEVKRAQQAMAPEASIAMDLVVKKEEPAPRAAPVATEPSPAAPAREPSPALAAAHASEASVSAAGVPRRRGRGWLVVLLLLAAAGGGVYAARDRVPWDTLRSMVGMSEPSPPAATPVALPPPPVATVTAPPVVSAMAPVATATATASAAPAASGATAAPSAKPGASATAKAASSAPSSKASGHAAPPPSSSAKAAPKREKAQESESP